MSSQGQQSGKGGQGYGMQPGYGQGYGQSPYQMNPAQQGSFFSNGGSNRPQFGNPGEFGASGIPALAGYQNALQGMQNPLARGGYQTSPYQWAGPDPQPGPYGVPETFTPPGVQTFQNGAYANWGQPNGQTGAQTGTSFGGSSTAQSPTNLFGPSMMDTNGQLASGIQNPLAPPGGVQTFQNGAYGNWGAQPNTFANPLARPFTNGY